MLNSKWYKEICANDFCAVEVRLKIVEVFDEYDFGFQRFSRSGLNRRQTVNLTAGGKSHWKA